MSIALAERETRQFLLSPGPGVFCLTGKWGVGKTFSWNRTLAAVRAGNPLKETVYSYVSLFGIESLDKLRTAVFEAGQGLGPETGNKSGLKERLVGWRAHVDKIRDIPLLKDYVPDLTTYMFASVNNYLVCFDDIERRSDKLDLKDFLGLASYLRDSKGCKVVLVLNDGALGAHQSEFDTYLEKVSDARVVYEPTAEESSHIAFYGRPEDYDYLISYAVMLGITNIRVLQRICRFFDSLYGLLDRGVPGLISRAARSTIVLGWAIYEPTVAPTLDFITRRRVRVGYGLAESFSPEENRWDELLKNAGFHSLDDFDELIIAGLKKGYFDDEQIRSVSDRALASMRRADTRKNYDAMWRQYQNDLSVTSHTWTENLTRAFRESVTELNVNELNVSVRVLRRFDAHSAANELINIYLSSRIISGVDLEYISTSSDPFDEAVEAMVRNNYVPPADGRDIIQVLDEIQRGSGWNEHDISRLESFTVDQYISAYLRNDVPNLGSLIRRALSFGNMQHGGIIAEKSVEALRQIASTDALRAVQVKGYGVSIE